MLRQVIEFSQDDAEEIAKTAHAIGKALGVEVSEVQRVEVANLLIDLFIGGWRKGQEEA